MTIEDILESKGLSSWNNVTTGLDLDNSMLNEEDIKLIQKRVVDELILIRREFSLAACNKKNFSLCEAYSDFSNAAYVGLSELCFNPQEVLNNLPRRARNYQEESIKRTISKVRLAQGVFNVVLSISGAVILGSLKNTAQDTTSDYLTHGFLGVVGGTLGYFASKAIFYLPVTSLKSRLGEERAHANKAFIRSIDEYIGRNIETS
ncbi:MAG: hypothetical protein WC979_06625 [Candidatus Pacearchaeota archaeon]|jgi:phosphoribosyl-ATP pyrophosphohydrolase